MAVPLYTSHALVHCCLHSFTYLKRFQKFTMKIKLCVYFILENHNRNNFFRPLSLLSVCLALTWRKYINFSARCIVRIHIFTDVRAYTTPTQARAQSKREKTTAKKNLFMLLWCCYPWDKFIISKTLDFVIESQVIKSTLIAYSIRPCLPDNLISREFCELIFLFCCTSLLLLPLILHMMPS